MIQSVWPSNINMKFYAGKKTPKENVELTENLSGRVIGHRINTKSLMKISCSIRLSKNEQLIFWDWFNNTICQTSGSFYCSGLGSEEQLYRFTSIPDVQDTEQKYNELSLELEEVF